MHTHHEVPHHTLGTIYLQNGHQTKAAKEQRSAFLIRQRGMSSVLLMSLLSSITPLSEFTKISFSPRQHSHWGLFWEIEEGIEESKSLAVDTKCKIRHRRCKKLCCHCYNQSLSIVRKRCASLGVPLTYDTIWKLEYYCGKIQREKEKKES